jgi:DNA-binding transcriptional MerR regulator
MPASNTNDDEIKKLYFHIQEVSDQTGLPQSTIRYYCNYFKEFIPDIGRGKNRYRKFKQHQIDRLNEIKQLVAVYKLPVVTKILRSKGKENLFEDLEALC